MSRKGAWPETTPPEGWYEDAIRIPPGPRSLPSGAPDGVPDSPRVEVVDRAPTVAEAVRVATEHAPAAGAEAPDRVLGPWADEAVPRAVLAIAVAAAAWFPPDVDDEAPWVAWARQEPVPPAVDRARFRAVANAPWGLWWLDGVGDRAVLRDAVGLGPRWVVEEPVWVQAVALVGPVRAVAARVVRTTAGPVAALAIGLPGLPEDVMARADALVAAVRASGPRLSREEVLRRHGHVLVRSVAEWAWLRR